MSPVLSVPPLVLPTVNGKSLRKTASSILKEHKSIWICLLVFLLYSSIQSLKLMNHHKVKCLHSYGINDEKRIRFELYRLCNNAVEKEKTLLIIFKIVSLFLFTKPDRSKSLSCCSLHTLCITRPNSVSEGHITSTDAQYLPMPSWQDPLLFESNFCLLSHNQPQLCMYEKGRSWVNYLLLFLKGDEKCVISNNSIAKLPICAKLTLFVVG